MALMWKNQTQSAYMSPWDPATAEDLAKELADLKENAIRRDGSISMDARLNMDYNAVCFMGDDVRSVTCAVTRGAMVEHVRNALENKVDSSTLQEQTASLRATMMEATDNVSENTKRMLHLRRDIEGIFSPLLIERTADLTGNTSACYIYSRSYAEDVTSVTSGASQGPHSFNYSNKNCFMAVF